MAPRKKSLLPENGAAGHRDLEKELQDAKTENERLKDQLLRKAAEFENFKRRNEADWQNFQRLANERILLSILPVVDDLARRTHPELGASSARHRQAPKVDLGQASVRPAPHQ